MSEAGTSSAGPVPEPPPVKKQKTEATEGGPGHKLFRTKVLDPRKIEIQRREMTYIDKEHGIAQAEKYFCRKLNPKDLKIGVDPVSQNPVGQNVFARLSPDELKHFIQELSFICEASVTLSERTFSQLMFENVLPEDPRYATPEQQVNSMLHRTERMFEVNLDPAFNRGFWRPPPLVGTNDTTDQGSYKWKLIPDAMYFLSLTNFTPQIRSVMSGYCFTIDSRRAFPYMTVEIKREWNLQVLRKAEEQVAAAAAMSLYNRCLLKLRRLEKSKHPWIKKHTGRMKHFAILLIGSRYYIYGAELYDQETDSVAQEEWKWPGCKVRELYQDIITWHNSSVDRLCDWVGQIHQWAYLEYLHDARKDLEHIIVPDIESQQRGDTNLSDSDSGKSNEGTPTAGAQ